MLVKCESTVSVTLTQLYHKNNTLQLHENDWTGDDARDIVFFDIFIFITLS